MTGRGKGAEEKRESIHMAASVAGLYTRACQMGFTFPTEEEPVAHFTKQADCQRTPNLPTISFPFVLHFTFAERMHAFQLDRQHKELSLVLQYKNKSKNSNIKAN